MAQGRAKPKLSGWNDHFAAEDHDIIGHAVGLTDGLGGDLVLRANARKRVARHDRMDGGSAVGRSGWSRRRHDRAGFGRA